MIRRPPRSTRVRSSAASDVYKRQGSDIPDTLLVAASSFYISTVSHAQQVRDKSSTNRADGVRVLNGACRSVRGSSAARLPGRLSVRRPVGTDCGAPITHSSFNISLVVARRSSLSGPIRSDTVRSDPTPLPIQACSADCLLYTSPSPRDRQKSRMPSSA